MNVIMFIATDRIVALLKILYLAFECCNKIICNQHVRRAWLCCNLRNPVKKMVSKTSCLILFIKFQGYSQSGSLLANILFTLWVPSVLIIHSVIVISYTRLPPILEVSHVQILALYSMRPGLAVLWTGTPSLMIFLFVCFVFCFLSQPFSSLHGYRSRAVQRKFI